MNENVRHLHGADDGCLSVEAAISLLVQRQWALLEQDGVIEYKAENLRYALDEANYRGKCPTVRWRSFLQAHAREVFLAPRSPQTEEEERWLRRVLEWNVATQFSANEMSRSLEITTSQLMDAVASQLFARLAREAKLRGERRVLLTRAT